MEDNQPNKPSAGSDPEWEAIRKKTPGLKDEEPEPEKKPEPPVPPKKEEEPPAKPEPEEEEEEKPRPQRPEKYIPIKQYTDEKKTWKESIAERDARIAELEKVAGGKADTSKNNEAIKNYAEKYGIDIEVAKEQVESLREVLGVTDRKPTELSEDQKTAIQEAELALAEKKYSEEFKNIALPELKTLFPNATAEQLDRAKDEIERIACTNTFLDKTLDFVVYKSQKELAGIFSGKKPSVEPQRRAAQKGQPDLTAQDFKDGKTSFNELAALSGEQVSKIIEDMDIPTYEKYKRWNAKNDKLVINRGGRKIEF